MERDWEDIYRKEETPWDIGEPEASLVKAVSDSAIKPCKVLELGCGNGNDAIFLAKNGFEVTAVDISRIALENAKKRSKGLKIKFIAEDVISPNISGNFDLIYDRACFHFISPENRKKYLENIKKLLNKEGLFILIVSSDKDSIKGPYTFSKSDIENIFGKDFDILEMRLITLEQHKLKPKPWFCFMKRR